VDTPDGRGTIIEIELLRQRVKVRMEDQPETVGVYRNDEIAVLRSGKAKKNDPPIPEDLAPISGGKKPRRRFESEEKFAGLDAIKFRYSTDTVADGVVESVAPEAPETSEEETKENRNNRRNRRNRKPSHSDPAPEKPVQQEKPKEKAKPAEKPKEKPKAEENQQPAQEGQKKSNHRRRFYHHRNKKGGENKGS
jgi:hypothetical protein